MRPEIYQADVARQVLGVNVGDWHLAVKPIEHLRPFHGIPNVFVCDWPFAELSGQPLGHSPFFDQVRLLRMADLVICCTDFTRDTLRTAGVERAITLPPHIPNAAGQTEQREASDTRLDQAQTCRFLSVVEANQKSRQLATLLEGFADAVRCHHGLRLMICVHGADEATLAGLRRHVALTTRVETTSVFASAGTTIARLHASADFFLCTNAAAGLDLPLIDAMLAGVPVVTTMEAGTASFVPAAAVVPIATECEKGDGDGEAIGLFMPLTSHPPSIASVRDAILAAASLDPAARSRLAIIGRANAERRFGLAAFREGLRELDRFVSRETAEENIR